MCVYELLPAEKLPLPQIFLWLSLLMRPQLLSPISTPLVTEVMEEFTFVFAQFPFCLNRDLGLGCLWQGKEEYYHFFLL